MDKQRSFQYKDHTEKHLFFIQAKWLSEGPEHDKEIFKIYIFNSFIGILRVENQATPTNFEHTFKGSIINCEYYWSDFDDLHDMFYLVSNFAINFWNNNNIFGQCATVPIEFTGAKFQVK